MALLVAGCNRIQAERGARRGPSVLLVTIDTLRADHVGAYGSPRAKTPTLDALAARGVRFERASATVPLTLPSHTSILTGLYPPHHGVRHNAIFRAGPELETLAERFRAAGYATGAVLGAAVLDREFGLDQGFDVYDDAIPEHRSGGSGFHERTAREVSDAALAFLAEQRGPVFLWLHYYDPHTAYRPPPKFLAEAGGDTYAGEIAYVDAELGRVIEALRASGRLDDTLVSVTADHGEGLGEHGEATHTYLVYESVLHVPWIVSGPGVPAGRTVARVVSNAAVAPTLLELAALSPLPNADAPSAVPLWQPDAPQSGGVAYAESLAGQLDFGSAPIYALRDGSDKLIDAGARELYDLAADPRELRDRSREDGARAERLAAQLGALRAGERALARSEIDPALRAQIEALGYVVPRGEDAPAAEPVDIRAVASIYSEMLERYARGDAAGAERIARDLVARIPTSVRAHEFLAHLYLERGRPADALPHALATTRLQPEVANYHAMLGAVHLKLGDAGAAVRAFAAAAALDEASARAQIGLMWRMKAGGSAADAERAAERALALDRDAPATWDAVGESWESLSEAARAQATYARAAERFPREPRFAMRLAIAAVRDGDAQAAQRWLAAAGEAARDPRLASRLAIAYAARGEYAQAEPILRELVQRDPASPARVYLARLLRETGRAEEAEQILRGPAAPPAAPAAASAPRG
jgi:arylsulfatase A-like enzyme/Flp pilus assembly protein TadD